MQDWLTFLSLPHSIWQLAVDSGAGWVVVEIRSKSPENLQVIFFHPDRPDLQFLSLPTAETWWMRLFGAYMGIGFLVSYSDPSLPISQGIWAFDLSSNELLWSAPHLQAQSITEAGIWASNPQLAGVAQCFDLRMGTPKQARPPQAGEDLRHKGFIFPQPMPFEAWQTAHALAFPFQEPQTISACAWKQLQLATWASREGETSYQEFAIWREGELAKTYRYVRAEGPAPGDTFMVTGSTLLILEGEKKIGVGKLDQLTVGK